MEVCFPHKNHHNLRILDISRGNSQLYRRPNREALRSNTLPNGITIHPPAKPPRGSETTRERDPETWEEPEPDQQQIPSEEEPKAYESTVVNEEDEDAKPIGHLNEPPPPKKGRKKNKREGKYSQRCVLQSKHQTPNL